ncbi:MAG: long-chain fatty acid--CoA ligase, partial [Methylophilaceae bacterium]
AQWLGGVAVPLDLLADRKQIQTLLQKLNPAYVFAEGQEEVELLNNVGLKPTLVVYADARGLSGNQQRGVVDYSTISEINASRSSNFAQSTAQATDRAFVFYRLDVTGNIQLQSISHHELLSEGRILVTREHLTHKEEALAARAFAASGHARYLLAPWLQAGFRLNFPENLVTRDNDRRELGPTLVAGTRQTYQRLESLVLERLPQIGTWRRKWIDRVLALNHSQRTSTLFFSLSLQRLLDYWLVIRPLRDVIGFSRTRVPLLVGEPLSVNTERFYLALGIEVRNWVEPMHWQVLDLDATEQGRLGVLSHQGQSSNEENSPTFNVAGVNA